MDKGSLVWSSESSGYGGIDNDDYDFGYEIEDYGYMDCGCCPCCGCLCPDDYGYPNA